MESQPQNPEFRNNPELSPIHELARTGTVQSPYKTPHYITDLNLTCSLVDPKFFVPWKFTK